MYYYSVRAASVIIHRNHRWCDPFRTTYHPSVRETLGLHEPFLSASNRFVSCFLFFFHPVVGTVCVCLRTRTRYPAATASAWNVFWGAFGPASARNVRCARWDGPALDLVLGCHFRSYNKQFASVLSFCARVCACLLLSGACVEARSDARRAPAKHSSCLPADGSIAADDN